MAESVTVRVDGLKELADKLRGMGPDLSRNALRAGVRAAAKLVKDDAAERVPVDTGTLKRALYMKQIREKSSAWQQTFYVAVRRGKAQRKRALDAYYWRFVEFGTAKMAARPFLRPAFEANKRQAVDVIAERLKARIESHGRRK